MFFIKNAALLNEIEKFFQPKSPNWLKLTEEDLLLDLEYRA